MAKKVPAPYGSRRSFATKAAHGSWFIATRTRSRCRSRLSRYCGSDVVRRTAALTGLIFVALSGSAQVAVPQMPAAGAPPAVVVSYIEANQQSLELTWFLAGEVAWLFGLYF